MKMKQTIQQLKKLKRIMPSKNFSEQSRLLLVSGSNKHAHWATNRLSEVLRYLGAVSLTAFLIIFIIGGFSYLQKSNLPLMIAGLDPQTLRAEAESLEIDVTISKLNYFEANNHTVKTALNQTIKDNPVYFEEVILNKETETLNLSNPTNQDIDEALDEIFN